MVDGMSSYRYYENGTDIIDFLQNKFASDHSKSYVMLPIPEVTIPPMGIKGNRKYRMFIYKPDGSVFIKRHICACAKCLEGNVIDCEISKDARDALRKKTKKRKAQHEDSDANNEDVDDIESDEGDDEDDDNNDDNDEDGGDAVTSIFEVVTVGSIISLYTPSNIFEPFYLCKVLELCTAKGVTTDNEGHSAEKGEKYLKCYYLQLKPKTRLSK